MIFTFLPSTCLQVVDSLSEDMIELEYSRVVHLAPEVPSTRSKLSLTSRREFLKSLLSNNIWKPTFEDAVLSALDKISNKVVMKDGSTNTDELPESASTETPSANTDVEVLPALQEVPFTSPGYKRPLLLGLPGCNINIKRDILMKRHSSSGPPKERRTLFLTDSILKGIDPRSFSTHKNELCIKKTMYYLTDISNFEPEFENTDHVIISAGINDITRKYLPAEAICDIILPQIRRYSKMYPRTLFTFNSVILTSCTQPNEFVHDLICILRTAYY